MEGMETSMTDLRYNRKRKDICSLFVLGFERQKKGWFVNTVTEEKWQKCLFIVCEKEKMVVCDQCDRSECL